MEGRFEVVEKRAVARGDILGVVACHAGTRNPGRVTGLEAMAWPNCLPRLGANMAAIGVVMAVVCCDAVV